MGGGEIGRPGYPVETTKMDKEIIKLTGKLHPRLLFVPTASFDSESYYEVVKQHFGKKLGCRVGVLYLMKDKLTRKQIEEKAFNSDIIYVGGGNTANLMKVWRKTGFDEIVKKAGEKGAVLSGLSAGSICWFRYGLSDSRGLNDPRAVLMKVSGLGLIGALHTPHYDIEPHRQRGLKLLMKKTPGVAIAIENRCAIEVIDDKYRIISSKKNVHAYKVYWEKNRFYREVIPQRKEFRLLSGILKK